jgi:hypothetical protein
MAYTPDSNEKTVQWDAIFLWLITAIDNEPAVAVQKKHTTNRLVMNSGHVAEQCATAGVQKK